MSMELEDVLRIRENFYGFLYRMYLEEPPVELAEDIVRRGFPPQYGGSLNEDMVEGFHLLGEFGESGKDAGDIHEQLVNEYTRLFIGPGRLPVAPYESVWIDGRMMGESLLKVKKEYLEACIEKSKEYSEPEDHIAFELRFMHYLCEKELNSEDEGKLNYLHAQRDFLDGHLLIWVPGFCDALFECDSADFYRGIAKVTRGFVLLDSIVVDELIDLLS